jgi:WD40 repeat protein
VKTGQETFTYKGNEQDVTLAFSPNGRFLSAVGRGYVRVWEVTGRVVLNYPGRPIPVGGGIATRLSLAFSPDSGSLAVANLGSVTRVWDLSTGRERFPQRWASPPDSMANLAEKIYGGGVAFSPDGHSLAIGSPLLRVLDAASGAELHTPGHIGPVASMAVHPVERTLAAGVGQVVRLFELGSWHPMRTFGGHNGEVAGVAFSPNGRLLAAGDGIWDLTEGRQPPRAVQPPLRRLDGNPRGITTLAFSPNAQLLFTFGAGSVKVWDVTTGRELSSGKLAVKEKGAVVFSPDARLLACVGENFVRLWDLSKNQEARVLTVEDKMRRGITVNALAFSPDGRRLAAVGVGIIRLWDTRTFQELYTIAPVGPTGRLAFSPDGGQLMAVGAIQIVGRESTPLSGSTTGAGAGEQRTVVIYDGRPLTPEREIEREALGILDQLFSRPLPRKDVLALLRTSPALSDPVRQAALRLAAHYQE